MNCFELKLKLCPSCKSAKAINNWDGHCIIETYKREIGLHIENNSLKQAIVFWLTFSWMIYYIEQVIKHYYPEHTELLMKYLVLV